MPAKKTSVYLIQRTLDVAGEGESLSGRLNQIVARYDDLIRLAMPEFSEKQWCAIFDANNGTILSIDNDPHWPGNYFAGVWANVADSRGFDEKWGVDVQKLSARLRDLEPAQKIAVVEAIQTFWEHHEKPTEEALAKAIRRG
jgi:hypothetical protein